MAPPPLIRVLRRVVNTVRFLEASSQHSFCRVRAASTGREVAHRLAYPPRGQGVIAVPRPAPLTEQRAPKDPRQDSTSGSVESGQKRNETACGICVQRLFTACPGAQLGRLVARHRRAESCIVQEPLEPLDLRSRHQQPKPGLPLPGMLVFHFFGVQSRDSRQGPDLGALLAGDCRIFVLLVQ